MDLLVFLLILKLCYLASSNDGMIYYVAPYPASVCPRQPCRTLQYLVDNINAAINQYSNVTLIFMKGNHSVKDVNVTIMPAVLRMTGESSNYKPTIRCEYQSLRFSNKVASLFYNVRKLHVKHLVVESCMLTVSNSNEAYFVGVTFLDTWNIWIYNSNATMIWCRALGQVFDNWLARLVVNSAQVKVENCQFHHPTLTTFLLHSSVTFSDSSFVGSLCWIDSFLF